MKVPGTGPETPAKSVDVARRATTAALAQHNPKLIHQNYIDKCGPQQAVKTCQSEFSPTSSVLCFIFTRSMPKAERSKQEERRRRRTIQLAQVLGGTAHFRSETNLAPESTTSDDEDVSQSAMSPASMEDVSQSAMSPVSMEDFGFHDSDQGSSTGSHRAHSPLSFEYSSEDINGSEGLVFVQQDSKAQYRRLLTQTFNLYGFPPLMHTDGNCLVNVAVWALPGFNEGEIEESSGRKRRPSLDFQHIHMPGVALCFEGNDQPNRAVWFCRCTEENTRIWKEIQALH